MPASYNKYTVTVTVTVNLATFWTCGGTQLFFLLIYTTGMILLCSISIVFLFYFHFCFYFNSILFYSISILLVFCLISTSISTLYFHSLFSFYSILFYVTLLCPVAFYAFYAFYVWWFLQCPTPHRCPCVMP